MINVIIFALPMSSTYITFSGLTAVVLVAFGMKPRIAQGDDLVTVQWLVVESLIWVTTPLLSIGLTYIM